MTMNTDTDCVLLLYDKDVEDAKVDEGMNP